MPFKQAIIEVWKDIFKNMSRSAFYKKYFKKVVWDYDIRKIDLDKDESIFKWFLERKINYDGLRGIRKKDLLQYYKKLNIDPSYKYLIKLIDQKNNSQ